MANNRGFGQSLTLLGQSFLTSHGDCRRALVVRSSAALRGVILRARPWICRGNVRSDMKQIDG